MKRIIEKYRPLFNRPDGTQLHCIGETVEWSEIPADADMTGIDVVVMNVMYDDCTIQIRNFDKFGNRLIIHPPAWLKSVLFTADSQGQEQCIRILTKLNYESGMIHRKEKIPYDNTIA